MGRKAAEELEKIVSTKLSAGDYQFLQKYAKDAYDAGAIELPTVSHAVRLIVKIKRANVLRKLSSHSSTGEKLDSDKPRAHRAN